MHILNNVILIKYYFQKIILKDIDPALIRNLSDDHGNNLWHICAVHNNFECLNWLCSHNPHHVEALKDENKNGFSPVSLAVKVFLGFRLFYLFCIKYMLLVLNIIFLPLYSNMFY